jgi:hypothetical protein
MFSNFKTGVAVRVRIRMYDSTNAIVASLVQANLTGTLLLPDGTTATLSFGSNGDSLTEITTGAFASKGLYEAVIGSARITLPGDYNLAVHVTATPTTHAIVDFTVADQLASDVYARLGAPVGASISADVASVKTSVGSVTGSVGSVTGNVGGSVASVTGNVAGSVASVVGTVGSVTGLTTATITNAVWDEGVLSHVGIGTMGSYMGSAGTMLSKAVPGAFSVGTAGYVLGTNLDAAVSSRSTYAGGAVASVTGNVGGSVASVVGLTASNLDTTVSSRLPTSSYVAPDNASIALIKAKTDALTVTPVAGPIMLNHNYGGLDNLQAVSATNEPIPNCDVRVYTEAQWIASDLDSAIGVTKTDTNGRWVSPIFVAMTTNYYVQFHLPNVFGPNAIKVVVP